MEHLKKILIEKIPFSFESIEIINGEKYKIIHTVNNSSAGSRIITYKIVKQEI